MSATFFYFLFLQIQKNLRVSFDNIEIHLYSSTPVAGVAQLVERNLAKVEVASSRLVSRSNNFCWRDSKAAMQRIANPFRAVRLRFAPPVNAGVAQLVERNLAKVEVASSRLVSRSN